MPESSTPNTEVTFPHDTVNEQVVVAAGLVSAEAREGLVRRLKPDQFFEEEHRIIWAAITEMVNRKLAFDLATLQSLTRGETQFDSQYVVSLMEARPDAPPNLEHHVSMLQWDYGRLNAVRGPISALLASIKDPRTAPDRVRSLARSVSQAFDEYEDRRFLLDPIEVVRAQMADLDERIAGRSLYPYGIKGLDFYLNEAGQAGEARLIPGTAPGLITVITGVSGSGKSPLAMTMGVGIARQKRKVLYGAWEIGAGETLELMAAQCLRWSKTDLAMGRVTPSMRVQLEEKEHAICQYVRFMERPFGKTKKDKMVNDRNLDIIQGYLSDTGCEVAIFDLWKRCLRQTDPDEEEHALIRQQAMAEELQVHCILVQQQRLKDVEARIDKRPTREGIKGSGAWVEVPDMIFGVYRPALFKKIDDVVLEVDVLKQRRGPWPLAVEFDWDGERGLITGGRPIPYEQPGESSEGAFGAGGTFAKPKRRKAESS